MKPVNLKERFGDSYRIEHDPAASHEPGGRKNPWYHTIPCRNGHIYPHSDKLLALWWESSTRLDRQCPALTLYQDGDDEKTYLFNPEDFEEVARIAHPKRKRRLTSSQRQKAIQRLRAFQFS